MGPTGRRYRSIAAAAASERGQCHVVSVRWQVNADLFFSDRKHVCIEPPPSALNVTLPAIAAERRRTCSTVRAAIDRSRASRALSNKPADRCCCCRSMGETGGRSRTDARALHRPCCKYYAGSANSSPVQNKRLYTTSHDMQQIRRTRPGVQSHCVLSGTSSINSEDDAISTDCRQAASISN